MTLRDYLKIFRRRWLVILGATLVAAAVVFAITPSQASNEAPASSYTATSTLLVSPVGAAEQTESLSRLALFITNGEVPVKAAEALGYPGDPVILAQSIEVTYDSTAQAIAIAATNSDGDTASDRANAFAEAAVEFFDAERTAELTILQQASPVPDTESSGSIIPPGRGMRSLLAACVGLLLGLGLAIIIDNIDNRLRSMESIEAATGIPIIGTLPKLPRGRQNYRGILTHEEPLSPYADGYRAARSALLHTATAGQYSGTDAHPKPLQVILVTSAMAGEGKTTSSANLAASFAESGKRVLVVDADLRKADVHHYFDVPQGAGVSDFLVNPDLTMLQNLLRPTSVPGVAIISAGTQLDAPATLTSRMAPLIEAARTIADIVIVDTSPLLMASDAFDILPLVDSVLLVTRSGRLTAASASRVAELIGRFDVPIAGSLVIGISRTDDNGYGYGYGYGYGVNQQKKRPRRRRKRRSQRPAARSQTPPRSSAHPDTWLPDPAEGPGRSAPRHGRTD